MHDSAGVGLVLGSPVSESVTRDQFWSQRGEERAETRHEPTNHVYDEVCR